MVNKVSVNVSHVSTATVWGLEIPSENGYILISIQDNGSGISPDFGLLSIKAVMRKHRGKWMIERNELGTKLSLFLSVETIEKPRMIRNKALLVDDDIDILNVQKDVLESYNYDRIAVMTYHEAMERLTGSDSFVLAIIDENLDGGKLGSDLIKENIVRCATTTFAVSSGEMPTGVHVPGSKVMEKFPSRVWGFAKLSLASLLESLSAVQ